ncbi:hypothetical protein KQ51_00788 [Candidatus Izimaplasma bacterium HR1]|jgi:hypothetical protein|uniref:hypothetical protein n=1 Tax=Candidatus Izimoplasma sp. HR1 TaxID=1541959 RepID=UPI0004F67C93|nr:hypothetical protein KQ51_00788 [Candidatus Izimaplasma bacterium HR1]
MKRIVLLIAAVLVVVSLSACEDICVGPECLGEVGAGESDGYSNGQGEAVPFVHLNGEGHEVDMNAYVLMEYNKLADYVIYQLTYLSCTCRDGDVNFWNTVYVQINKGTNDIRLISWHYDFNSKGDEGHYLAGAWGDSSGAAEQGGITLEDLEEGYFPWFLEKTLADLDGMVVATNGTLHGMTNAGAVDFTETNGWDVDDFSASTVSTNNFLRVMIELLRYHEANY